MNSTYTRFAILLALLAPALAGCIPSRAVANYRFRGQVLDAKGQPVPSADVRIEIAKKYEAQSDPLVTLAGQKREQRFSGTTDQDGAFSIEGKALHFVNYNVPGIMLFAVIGPVVTWVSSYETKEDVRHDLPTWLGWMLTMPVGIPHASYTTMRVFNLGKPVIAEQLRYDHYKGEKRMLVDDSPVFFKDYDFGQVVIGGKKKPANARGNVITKEKEPSSRPLPPPPARPAITLPPIQEKLKVADPTLKQKPDAPEIQEMGEEVLVPLSKGSDDPPAAPPAILITPPPTN